MQSDNEHIRLRRRTERRLGRSISGAAWTVASERGYVSDALDPAYGPAGEAELIKFLEDLLRVADHEVGTNKAHGRLSLAQTVVDAPDLNARVEAITRLAGDHAAGDEAILRFRRRVLGRDGPVTADEAEAFIDSHTARGSAASGRNGGRTVERLEYQNVHVNHSLAVWSGSPLDELRLLAEDLATSYPWEPAQAAAFVLEGLTPVATPFLLHLPQVWHEGRPRRARIVMEIDMWMPASAVLRAYREVQRQVLPGHNRPLSRRSIDLVNFVGRHRPATWPELLLLWNHAHKDGAYRNYRHMRFAFERARRSILTPSYRLHTG